MQEKDQIMQMMMTGAAAIIIIIIIVACALKVESLSRCAIIYGFIEISL